MKTASRQETQTGRYPILILGHPAHAHKYFTCKLSHCLGNWSSIRPETSESQGRAYLRVLPPRGKGAGVLTHRLPSGIGREREGCSWGVGEALIPWHLWLSGSTGTASHGGQRKSTGQGTQVLAIRGQVYVARNGKWIWTMSATWTWCNCMCYKQQFVRCKYLNYSTLL